MNRFTSLLAAVLMASCGATTTPSPRPDAGFARDASSSSPDAGPVDAGEEFVDAGEELVDAGEELVDAGFEEDGGTLVADAGDTLAPMPDFSLLDENDHSALHGTRVSPRQFLTRATAWYFGHST